MSSSPTAAGGCKGALSIKPENRETLCVVIDGNPVQQVRNVAPVRQAVRQRRLVNQELGATVSQHVGNFRLLLARAQQNRDDAEMRRTEQRKHELDAIAEQQRDPVPALQTQLAQARPRA